MAIYEIELRSLYFSIVELNCLNRFLLLIGWNLSVGLNYHLFFQTHFSIVAKSRNVRQFIVNPGLADEFFGSSFGKYQESFAEKGVLCQINNQVVVIFPFVIHHELFQSVIQLQFYRTSLLNPALKEPENVFDNVFSVSHAVLILAFVHNGQLWTFLGMFGIILAREALNRFQFRVALAILRVGCAREVIQNANDPIFELDFCYFDHLFLTDGGEVVFYLQGFLFSFRFLHLQSIFV